MVRDRKGQIVGTLKVCAHGRNTITGSRVWIVHSVPIKISITSISFPPDVRGNVDVRWRVEPPMLERRIKG